jgi:hypothetical protein
LRFNLIDEMIRRKISLFFPFSLLLIVLGGEACQNDSEDKIPDVSDIKLEVKVQRFDKDLFAIDTNNLAAGVATLVEKYPLMMEIYPERIQSGNPDENTLEKVIGGFVKHPQVRRLYDTCQVVYNDMSDIDKAFTQSFKYFKYYFPKQNIPQVTTCITEYTNGVFNYGDSLLVVGLDFFLGENHTGYYGLGIPRYILRGLNKQHLVARAMEAYINGIAPDYNQQGKRLIDVMIDNGKKLYVLDKLMPYTADSVKLAYTQKQVEWCEKNEADVWAFLLSENLLYSVKSAEWAKLVNPSPTGTPKMPTDSPGRAGNWLGMKIVKAYMKRNPSVSLSDLLRTTDAQMILDKSKYKPKRK